MNTLGQIISLGSINVDLQVRAARSPAEGETFLGSDFLMVGGGKGANVAYLARRLKTAARLIGHIGDDVLGEVALRPLRAIGVDLHHVKAMAGQATGVAMITVHPNGKKTIVLAANANDIWTTAESNEVAPAIATAGPDSILVTDLEVPVFVVKRAAEAARQRGYVVVLDPSPADRMSADLYSAVDYVTPNPLEAKQLTGISVRSVEEAYRAGEVLVGRGVKTVLVKLGGGGCVVVTAGQQTHVPSPPVTVVDETGAGDAFAGALAVALLERRLINDAARFAVAAAALAVTRYGAQPSYPTPTDIEHMLSHPKLEPRER